jgi:hypothetical protein
LKRCHHEPKAYGEDLFCMIKKSLLDFTYPRQSFGENMR